MTSPLADAATRGGHLPSPAWWAVAGLALAYAVFSITVIPRARRRWRGPLGWIAFDPRIAWHRVVRLVCCAALGSVISAAAVLAHNHVHHARVVRQAAAGDLTPHAMLAWGFGGIAAAATAVLFLTGSLVIIARGGYHPAPRGRGQAGRGRGRDRRGRGRAVLDPGDVDDLDDLVVDAPRRGRR